jgi:crossover junction endodeoxyribonuclease RusA
MNLSLPFPPSVNTYWRSVNGRMLISKNGRRYRDEVVLIARGGRVMLDRLSVRIIVHPPDQRQRDLDNLPKSILDALEHAGVYADDSQIDELYIKRAEVIRGGKVVVTVLPIAG